MIVIVIIIQLLVIQALHNNIHSKESHNFIPKLLIYIHTTPNELHLVVLIPKF